MLEFVSQDISCGFEASQVIRRDPSQIFIIASCGLALRCNCYVAFMVGILVFQLSIISTAIQSFQELSFEAWYSLWSQLFSLTLTITISNTTADYRFHSERSSSVLGSVMSPSCKGVPRHFFFNP